MLYYIILGDSRKRRYGHLADPLQRLEKPPRCENRHTTYSMCSLKNEVLFARCWKLSYAPILLKHDMAC